MPDTFCIEPGGGSVAADMTALTARVGALEALTRGTGTAGEAISGAGLVLWRKSNGKLRVHDGTVTAASAIVGVSDAAYSNSATASYFRSGSRATGLSGLTDGDELYAKSDGTLGVFSALSVGDFTLKMGVAFGTTAVELVLGADVQEVGS